MIPQPPPQLVSAFATDVDGIRGLGAGDTVLLTFNESTNMAGFTNATTFTGDQVERNIFIAEPLAQLSSLVSWGGVPFAYSCKAVWTSATQLLITVTNPTLGWASSRLQVCCAW